MPEVRPATAADLPAIGRALAAAFEDDPVWRWLVPVGVDWPSRAPAWFEREARNQMEGHGVVLVDDEVRGAAIWAPPKRWRAGVRDGLSLAIPSLRLFGSRLPKSLGTIASMEKRHPREPEHWYLAVLGTDPAHQGVGIGGALIRAVTDRCDEQGLPAYLESSKERNVPYYARFGFALREEVQLGGHDGPKIWTMWRDPKG